MISLHISNNYSEIPAAWNTPVKSYNSPGLESEIGVLPQRAAVLGIAYLVVSLIYYCIKQLAAGEPRVASARIKSKETKTNKAPALPSLKTQVITPSSLSQQVPVGDSTQVAPSGINAVGNSVPNSNLQVKDEAATKTSGAIGFSHAQQPRTYMPASRVTQKISRPRLDGNENEADMESVRKIDPDYELDSEDLFFEYSRAEKVWEFKEILGEFPSHLSEQEMKQSCDLETVPSAQEFIDFDPDLKGGMEDI